MRAEMLPIPPLLEELLTAGRWPRDAAEERAQNLKPRVPPERVRHLAAEEHGIYLFAPPFNTVREKSAQEEFWSWAMCDPGGIDFDLALDIGDFGIGSDTPILLDYREDKTNPRVIRLRWPRDGSPNRWVVMAPDFRTFVEVLGL